MKNKGYTLLELLGVIVILSVLFTLVFPSVINFIKKGNDKIDSITHDLIISAASDYAKDNSSELYLLDGGTHCVSIETLIGKNYLDESLIEEDLYTSKSVKITNIDKFKYEITDTDTCMVLASGLYDEHDRLLFSWDELVTQYDFKNKIEIGGYDPNTYEDLVSAGEVLDSIEGAATLVLDESVTSIGDIAFFECQNLKKLIIPDSVTNIDDAFEGTGITSITIPSSVRSMSNAFCNCPNLETVVIKEGVTNIGLYAFAFCPNLTSVTIPSTVTSIGEGTFKGCDKLSSVTIPNSVTNIGLYAFAFCPSLTSITIPTSVTDINCAAFEGSTNLTTIYYKGTATDEYNNNWGAENATIISN